jgi:hypothetical protein
MRRRINLFPPNSTIGLTVIAVLMVSGSVGCKSYTSNLQKSEVRADEASVTATLRTIAQAQQAHALTNGGNYATFLQLAENGYLDSRFASDAPEVHGYVMTMTVGDKTFSCNADPTLSGDLKGRHFYVDSTSSLIRVNATQPASAKDQVVKF